MKDHAFHAGWDTDRKLWIQRSWTLPVHRERMQIPGSEVHGLIFRIALLFPSASLCGLWDPKFPKRGLNLGAGSQAPSPNHWTAKEVPKFGF